MKSLSNTNVKVSIPGKDPGSWWYQVPSEISPLNLYDWVRVPLKSKVFLGVVEEISQDSLPFKTKPIIDRVLFLPTSLSWWRDLAWVSQHYQTHFSKTLGNCIPQWLIHTFEKTLIEKKDWPQVLAPKLKKESTPQEQSSGKKNQENSQTFSDLSETTNRYPPPDTTSSPTPNPSQRKIIHEISEFLKPSGGYKSFLLHGITGSGKTLIYTELAKLVDPQKITLLLLPEIALTPQLTKNFSKHLGLPIHTYHSGLSTPEKKKFWHDLIHNKIRVVIGVRSVILTPLINVGLVIVDEEHDSSYKQNESSPRYHARDVALVRAKSWDCPIVLGSATPSLETYQAAKLGKHHYLTLSERAAKASLPALHLIDMAKEWDNQGELPISVPLRDAMDRVLKLGNQVILLLNRRGFARQRICMDCRTTKICISCSCAMVPHKYEQKLKCHHCEYTVPYQDPCNQCQSKNWKEVGWGIEKCEEYLKKIFSEYTIDRLDRDSSKKTGALQSILNKFSQGETQILIGTQMVAKGHDFPNVQLVGILEADSALSLPDFRSQERLYQLMVQVAGRAGRAEIPGEVWIQTFAPNNPLFIHTLAQKTQNFLEEEMEFRKKLALSPYIRMAKVELEGPQEEILWDKSQALLENLQPYFKTLPTFQYIGPAFPLIKKLNNQFRVFILFKAPAYKTLHLILSQIQETAKKPLFKKIKFHYDVDPQWVI